MTHLDLSNIFMVVANGQSRASAASRLFLHFPVAMASSTVFWDFAGMKPEPVLSSVVLKSVILRIRDFYVLFVATYFCL